MKEKLRDLFRGALLGTFIGDALGMPVEGVDYFTLIHHPVQDLLPGRLELGTYTDDTEMMIGLAEALLQGGGILEFDRLAASFARNFNPRRGYGGNAARILRAIAGGADWKRAVERHGVPGGSFANGAAMRVAPVALVFYPEEEETAWAAEEQARVTGHTHPEGLFGARLQALAVLAALRAGAQDRPFDAGGFLESHLPPAPDRYRKALRWIATHLDAEPEEAVRSLGVSVLAAESVPAALWSFLSSPKDPAVVVLRAVNLGGDTDTIGALAGAVAGAYHGFSAFPEQWREKLENQGKGRDYVITLADQLWQLNEKRRKT